MNNCKISSQNYDWIKKNSYYQLGIKEEKALVRNNFPNNTECCPNYPNSPKTRHVKFIPNSKQTIEETEATPG